jgi:Amt family ammonium transporter
VFNLVFCATTATIVSGAMAERTKFSAYCVYSGVISLLIYPIEAHWIWGGGWLSSLGFHDYAGSCAIHMVGGIAALIGAAMLGPRIGKYVKDSSGKVTKVNAIPGHSIPLGALGVFILWLGWYGFNGAAATTVSELSSIFLTTTIAPSVATCTTMIYTWIKNGKPDVSMCLNASLAGLVGVTAGCDAFDAIGAAAVGIVSGFLVVIVVEVLDLKLHIDDPVGAVGVHCANGIWGTIAVGLLANPDAPAGLQGLFYTGDFTQLLLQLLGFAAVAAWAFVTMFFFFRLLKKMDFLRAEPADELAGLDISEHGLPSAYADFMPSVDRYAEFGTGDQIVAVTGTTPPAEAVPVKREPSFSRDGHKFTKVEIVFKEEKLYALKDAMSKLGITGMTVSHVMGYGMQKGQTAYYRGVHV